MARLTPVNAAFDAALRAVYGDADSTHLITGVYGALGVAHGAAPNPADFPVLGFYLDASDSAFLLYVVTPGRFIRYEVDAQSRSLTVAVPLARVSRVVELTAPEQVTVAVELDADVASHLLEYQESAAPNDPAALVGRTVGRTSRTTYEMTATTPDKGIALMGFSATLRAALGM